MKTSVDGIFAAGDCCNVVFEGTCIIVFLCELSLRMDDIVTDSDLSEHWFQMPLWSQVCSNQLNRLTSLYL
jgi:hypothetical protein